MYECLGVVRRKLAATLLPQGSCDYRHGLPPPVWVWHGFWKEIGVPWKALYRSKLLLELLLLLLLLILLKLFLFMYFYIFTVNSITLQFCAYHCFAMKHFRYLFHFTLILNCTFLSEPSVIHFHFFNALPVQMKSEHWYFVNYAFFAGCRSW